MRINPKIVRTVLLVMTRRSYPMNRCLLGLCTLAYCCLFSMAEATIEFLFLFKEKNYMQVGDNPPVSSGVWSFHAGVRGNNLVTGGTLEFPGSGGPIPLSGEPGNFSIDNSQYASQAEMDAAYPNGTMTLSINDNGLTIPFGPISLTGDNYVDPGRFLNLDELVTHDVSQDFQMEWSPFIGSDPEDKVVIQIYDAELDEDLLLDFLPNDTTSYTIPGGLLRHGFSYDMGFFFLNTTDVLDPYETVFGYVTSTYTNVVMGSLNDSVTIPDEAVRQVVKLELDILPESDVTYGEMLELTSLEITSGQPLDLTGLQHASGLSQLTLNAERILNLKPIARLNLLEEVKLVAPAKEGLFFTHWSDGSQENPRFVRLTGSKDLAMEAVYSPTPVSPFAGGYSLVVNGTVTGAFNTPEQLDVQIGDPYVMRFNYLIEEEAINESLPVIVSMNYSPGLLPRIAMEAELRIKNYRWFIRTATEGIGGALMATISQQGSEIFEIFIHNDDNEREYDFPFSYGSEEIAIVLAANSSQGSLLNGPAKIPDSPEYLNWDAITGGSFTIFSQTNDSSQNWFILLSHVAGPGQSYRLERLPSYYDSTQRILGYAANQPSVGPGSSTEYIELNWTDPHAQSFATTYEVWRGISGNRSSSVLVASGLTGTNYQDAAVLPGRNYFYWIRAIRDGKKADYSSPVSSFRAVSAPEDIQATQGDFLDRIRVSWTRVSGASSYAVYRSATNNLNNAELLQEGITVTEFEDFSPDTGDPYYYWVTGKALEVSSGFSAAASGYRVVNGITTVRASDGLYTDLVRIQWETFAGASSYTVYSNSVNDSGSASILATNITATQYDDLLDSENEGVPFFYWVRPQTGIQPGGFSNTDVGYSAVQRNTSILAWGDNDFDQTNIPLGDLTNVVEIAAGANHSLALQQNGTVVGWGRNEFGQATPPPGLFDVIDIAVGYDHSLALKRDGTVVAWGRNTFGKAMVPADLGHVIDIEAGAEHSLALLADGSVAAWGSNDFGQTAIPETLNQVVQISAGAYHNLVRRADGTVAAWGDNKFGQTEIPVRITQVIDIAAGWNHCLVLLPDGTVDGWGDNSRGQLDFPPDIQEPLQAKGWVVRDPVTARIVDISGGLFHSLALSAKGELSAWGESKNSQTESPQNLGVVSQIDAGDEFNLVVAEGTPAIESLIPGNTTLLSGEDLVLKVRATGGPDISYQWFFNNLPVGGATGEALFLSDVSPAMKGSYSVKVTSGGIELSSAAIQIDVTLNQATVANQTIRAIKSYDGTYLFSEVETDPPGLKLAIRSPGEMVLPSTTGTYVVSIEVDQKGYGAPPVENVTLILDTLNNEPLRMVETGSGMTIRYLAPEGFSCSLQTSPDMHDWIHLARVPTGDGLFHDFHLTSPAEAFYRVVFEVP